MAPLPPIKPESVRVVAPVVTSKAPVPPAAMVKALVLVALPPVYCSVPVCAPVLPRMTARALLPSVPLALTLLIEAMARVPSCTVNWPLKVLAPESPQVPSPLFVMPNVVALPLPMMPLMRLALVLLPLSVRTVAPATAPVMPPPMFKVPAPAPAPFALLLAKVEVPPAPWMMSGALMVSTAFVAVSVLRIWMVPPLDRSRELPAVLPMK